METNLEVNSKRMITVRLDGTLYDEVKNLKIKISETCRDALKRKVLKAKKTTQTAE